MKRALAERAKQSGLPNGVRMTASAIQKKSLPTSVAPTPNGPLSFASVPASGEMSSNNTNLSSITLQRPVVPNPQVSLFSQLPQKIAKLQVKKSSSATTLKTKTIPALAVRSLRATSASSSPRPKKRARESSVKLEDEDEDDSNAASFYLRHQNRALASELRSVKYQLMRLEREREHRRMQCLQAVQSLNALYIRWGKVEAALENQKNPKATDISSITNIEIPASDAPLSTGSGKSVEWIGALMNSLTRIGTTRSSKSKTRGNDDGNMVEARKIKNGTRNNDKIEVDPEEQICDEDEEALKDQKCVNDIMNLTEKMSERFSLLQSWIWTLMQNLDNSKMTLNGQLNGQSWSPPSTLELQNQVARAEAENITLQELVKELTRSRDEMVESDRRVRRGLYRLAAGRVKLKEVLKAVANADEGKESGAAWIEDSTALVGVDNTASHLPSSSSTLQGTENTKIENEDEKSPTSSKEIEQLKKQLSDLNVLASSRNEQIKMLMLEKEEQMKQINALVLKEDKIASDIPTTEEVQRSDLYFELTAKLAATTRKLEQLDNKSSLIKKEWSTALADAELSKKVLEDMQTIFSKRWTELTEEKRVSADALEGEGESSGIGHAKDIIILQHKLTQALENVRQAETLRKTLNEAVLMNNSLQSKVDEFKAKYNALQAEKAARSSSSGGGSSSQQGSSNFTPSKEGASTSKSKSSSSSTPTDKSDRSMDKLQRDYKRARKELAATIASKDAAKAKLERTEKEKDFSSQMNARLLKQASEKDEINAKSLSTILHLKQLSEQITKEKENLQQQVKSAGQLALAARLASNARDRVAEEFSNEQKAMKAQFKELEKNCSVLATEKELAEGKLSQEKARMSGLIRGAQKAKKRCEELATQSTKVQEEKRKIIESLAIAQRDASEATSLSQKLASSKGGGLVAGFTAEQLSTQVSHLKNRLACPVCNVRDKKCILLRCRHMFCKQCVDENVKNRSRKCPACGGRFDTKDIADVWL